MNVPIIVLGDVSGKYIESIESARGVVSVARHIFDLSDLLGVAQTGIARAVLLVSDFDDLTASLLASLAENDLSVVAVLDPGEPEPLAGISYISTLAEPVAVIELLERSVEKDTRYEPPHLEEKHSSSSELDQQMSEESLLLQQGKQGKIITFWGPAGSPGRSTLALNFAAQLASSKRRVCLIDADTYAPSQSSLLGMLDDYSSLSQLCHLADRGQLFSENLAEIISTVRIEKGVLDVVTGITRADRWPEIRSQALESVIEILLKQYDTLVIDTGFSLEADEELSFDGVAPRRNAATLTALEMADRIFLVGAADSLGIPRLMRATTEILGSSVIHIDQTALRVWINKVRSSSIGSQPEQQLIQSWQRFGPKIPISGFIPYGRESIDKSWLSGRTLIESSPKSAVTEAIRLMTEDELLQENLTDIQNKDQESEAQRIDSKQNLSHQKPPSFFSKFLSRPATGKKD